MGFLRRAIVLQPPPATAALQRARSRKSWGRYPAGFTVMILV